MQLTLEYVVLHIKQNTHGEFMNEKWKEIWFQMSVRNLLGLRPVGREEKIHWYIWVRARREVIQNICNHVCQAVVWIPYVLYLNLSMIDEHIP